MRIAAGVGQTSWKRLAGPDWVETTVGTPLDAANVRRSFRCALAKVEGIQRRSGPRANCVSLLSEYGVSVVEIARLVGHRGGSKVTELIYRQELCAR